MFPTGKKKEGKNNKEKKVQSTAETKKRYFSLQKPRVTIYGSFSDMLESIILVHNRLAPLEEIENGSQCLTEQRGLRFCISRDDYYCFAVGF